VNALRDIGVVWLGLVLAVVLCIAFLLPIVPNDYWWYVRLGGDIVATGSIPTVDVYSATAAGQPVFNPSWASAVVFWALDRAGGPTLTVLARGVLLAGSYALVWWACRLVGGGGRLSALVVLLAALAGSNNWAVRPQLISYPLFALVVVALIRWRSGARGWVWLLPAAMVLWVNLHGSFVLAFLLVGAALVGGGGDRRRLGLALAGMTLASLVNPRGVGAWLYVGALLSDTSSQVYSTEWRGPSPDQWQFALFFGWLLVAPVVAGLSRRRLSATEWLWYVGFGWMAVSGQRYVVWFLAVAAPITCALAAEWLRDGDGDGRPAVHGALLAGLLVFPVGLLPGLREHWYSEPPPVLSADTPVEAAAWLAGHPELDGVLWADLAGSSYLIHAVPDRPVWIDTRFELYRPEQFEDYLTVAAGRAGWAEVLERDGVGILVVDQVSQAGLIEVLEVSSGWSEVHRDERAAVWTRRRGGLP